MAHYSTYLGQAWRLDPDPGTANAPAIPNGSGPKSSEIDRHQRITRNSDPDSRSLRTNILFLGRMHPYKTHPPSSCSDSQERCSASPVEVDSFAQYYHIKKETVTV